MQRPSKKDRVAKLFELLDQQENATNSLLAYKMISETINQIEDECFGRDHWYPPRSFGISRTSDRLYPTYPESMFAVPDWPMVTVCVHEKELIFISATGAIEFQKKIVGMKSHYNERKSLVIYSKKDYLGQSVWHKN